MTRGTLSSSLSGIALLLVLASFYWFAAVSPDANVVTRLLRGFYGTSVVGPDLALKTLAIVFAGLALAGVLWVIAAGPSRR